MDEIVQKIKDFFNTNFASVPVTFDWGFFFGALGTWLGILAIIKDKRKENKEFELIQGDSILKTGAFAENEPIVETILYLRNTGNTVLKNYDFNNRCLLEFSDPIDILKISSFSSDKFSEIEISKKKKGVKIKIDMIEPQTYVKLVVTYKSSKILQASFSSNIIGGRKYKTNVEDHNFQAWQFGYARDSSGSPLFMLISFLLLWGLIIFLAENILTIKFFNPNFSNNVIPNGWIALSAVFALYAPYKIWKSLSFNQKKWEAVKEWHPC